MENLRRADRRKDTKMNNNNKITPEVFWTALIAAIVFWFITNIFDVFGRISGNNKEIEMLKESLDLKMDRTDADAYFDKLQTLQATQAGTWNQYMLSNEKDKERDKEERARLLKLIESNQKEILELIKNQNKIRGLN